MAEKKKKTRKDTDSQRLKASQISMRPSEEWLPETQTEKRVLDVAQLITKGWSRSSVQTYIRENFKVGERQARAYFSAAIRFLMPDDMEKYRAELIQQNISRLETIVEETMKDDSRNYNAAISAIKELNNLINPYRNNIEVQTPDTTFRISFGDNG